MTLNRRRNWKVAQNISKANCKLWAYSLSACSSDFVDLAPLVNLRIVCCNYADHGAPAPKSRTPLLLLLLLHSKRKPISDQLQPPLHCGIFFQIVAVRPCAISDLGLWRRRWNNEKKPEIVTVVLSLHGGAKSTSLPSWDSTSFRSLFLSGKPINRNQRYCKNKIGCNTMCIYTMYPNMIARFSSIA